MRQMSIAASPKLELTPAHLGRLAAEVKRRGKALGFQQIGITGVELAEDERYLQRWLNRRHHGEMGYMSRHGRKRSRPASLVPGTVRIISGRMDYWPGNSQEAEVVLQNRKLAYVSRYALGRDYHKVLRQRLRRLAQHIEKQIGPFGYRVFVDSAPVLEKSLARNAGLGWIGKHTNLLHHKAGSYFFLGEIFTDLPLPIDKPAADHCGTCRACIDICPTNAIIAPYELDARRCISYLTIELQGSIPEKFRRAIGNRIYGCDDCQLICPWNKFSRPTDEKDFAPRHGLDDEALVVLFRWSETEWASATEGSALRRTGYEGWLRNLAVALGNAPTEAAVVDALRERLNHVSGLVREHVGWALSQHTDC